MAEVRETFLELRRDLRSLPAKKRVDRILERKDALKAVRALPVHDIYSTIREVGVEDTLELLELCSPKQVQSFLDLDGWRGDRIDSGAMGVWLRAIVAANPDRAVGQLRGLDIELLTLLVKLHCRVYDLSQEEEPEEDVGLHSITPDQRYLIVYGGVGDDERMQQTLRDVFDRLMTRDILFVLRLCEAVRWDLPSSLEEESFRWRNARMSDLGFTPKHEALEIFAWRDPDAALDAPTTAKPPGNATLDEGAPSTDLSTSVLFPWDAVAAGAAAFGQAVQGVPEFMRERVANDVMLVANKVHCADGGDAGDPEAVRATAKQVVDTIGVALSYRCQGDPAKLPTILLSTSAQTLFRIGHSLGLKLQRELKVRIEARDSGLAGNGILRLDSPLREVAAGLLRARPLLFCGLLDPRRVDYRPPSSLVELAALSRAIAEIGFRGALLGPRGFGATDDVVAAHSPDAADQPSHGALLGALLARALLDQEPVLKPLSEEELASLQKAMKDAAKRAAVVDAVAQRARAFAPVPGAQTSDDVYTRTRAYASQVMDAAASELVVLDREPDRRFLVTVWSKATP